MISVFKSSSLGPVLLHFKQHVNNKEIVQWHWQHLLRLNSRSCSKVLHLPFFKGLWGFKRLLNLLYVIHFFPFHLLQWHLMHLSFFFFLCWLSWSFTFVPFAKFFSSSLSFNLAFSPTFIFYPAHSPVCSHSCHSSSFSLDWFLDFHSFLIILFCSFIVLYGCVVIFTFFLQLSEISSLLHDAFFTSVSFALPPFILYLFFPICCDLFYYFHFFNLFNLFAP